MPSGYDYRPLPPYLTVKPSNINGLGLFAVYPFTCGFFILWQPSHVYTGEFIYRTAIGSFINHVDENPNCELIHFPEENVLYVKIIQDIKEGEELTLNYNNNFEAINKLNVTT